MERRCTACIHPGYTCDTCPITLNYWTSLPSNFILSTSGITEDRIREIIKEELAKGQQPKNCGIVGTIKIEADVDSFKEAAECFSPSEEMPFEEAFTALRSGKRVTNKKWNGDNQYVFMMHGYESVTANETLAKASRIPISSDVCIAPYLMMRNSQGIYSNWVPSNGDLFSKSWKIID